MSWATRRRTLILIGLGLLAAAALSVFAVSVFYETPSCFDGKYNQDEEGVDCGGSCAMVCRDDAVPPVVSFVRVLPQGDVRFDIIAHVENPNVAAAAQNVRYTVELFSNDRAVLATQQGVVSIPARTSVPIFIPNAYIGTTTVAQAFLTFDPSSLAFVPDDGAYIIPTVSDVRPSASGMPRISARVHNPSPETLRLVPVVATVFNAQGVVIAASRTVIDVLPPQGSADVVFTWSAPFSSVPSRIDIRPAILPAAL